MGDKVSCASRIKEGLRVRGMTQADLCRITGIPKSAMSQYCSGGLVPRQDRTALIAQALNVNEAWLMGYDVIMERSSLTKDDVSRANHLLKSLVEQYKGNVVDLAAGALQMGKEEQLELFMASMTIIAALQTGDATIGIPIQPHTDGPQGTSAPHEGKDTTPTADVPGTLPEDE